MLSSQPLCNGITTCFIITFTIFKTYINITTQKNHAGKKNFPHNVLQGDRHIIATVTRSPCSCREWLTCLENFTFLPALTDQDMQVYSEWPFYSPRTIWQVDYGRITHY